MAASRGSMFAFLLVALLAGEAGRQACAGGIWETVFPEQRSFSIRDPSQIQKVPLPNVPAPVTVAAPDAVGSPQGMSLDEALCIALGNSQVIRVLAGTGVSASGSTIYDPAVNNTQIDVARGVFDPVLSTHSSFDQLDAARAALDPARITGSTLEDYTLDFAVSKRLATGATITTGVDSLTNQYYRYAAQEPDLNPQLDWTASTGITQPLLKGGGLAANLAPIEIARINTERSFFQMKDSVQQMVRSVVEAYWLLVAARVDVWARQQQVAQGREALDRAEASLRMQRGNIGEVAQARTSLAGFQSSLIGAQADLLQREAALRNLLGLPPADQPHMVPVTPPRTDRYAAPWEEVLRTAEQYRPDLIELKLILEADQQQLLVDKNNALPQANAVARYQWDGLRGRTGDYYIGTGLGEFTGWTLGVDFSVPLGLRAERAQLRQTELLIQRDKANLQQGLHNAAHSLATNFRNLDRYYEQYQMFRQAREAAQTSLEFQMAAFRAGRTIYLNVLLAINDWGNSVASEADALALYNGELANLQAQSGTILESHGIRFVEERFGSVGPLGRLFPEACYPRAMQPGPNNPQYPVGEKPAEDIFQLNRVGISSTKPPAPQPLPPTTGPETVPSPMPTLPPPPP